MYLITFLLQPVACFIKALKFSFISVVFPLGLRCVHRLNDTAIFLNCLGLHISTLQQILWRISSQPVQSLVWPRYDLHRCWALEQGLNPTLLYGGCHLLSLINCKSLWINASAKCKVMWERGLRDHSDQPFHTFVVIPHSLNLTAVPSSLKMFLVQRFAKTELNIEKEIQILWLYNRLWKTANKNWERKEKEKEREGTEERKHRDCYTFWIGIIKMFILSKLMFLTAVFPPPDKCISSIKNSVKLI